MDYELPEARDLISGAVELINLLCITFHAYTSSIPHPFLDCPQSGPGPVRPLFAAADPGPGPVLDLDLGSGPRE